MSLIVLAGQQKINADVVIVSDTGWENDMLWSTGERSTAQEYFERVINELAKMEATWQGQFFFTSQRIPLKMALAIMQAEYEARERNRQQQTSFLDEESEYPGCDSGYCFI